MAATEVETAAVHEKLLGKKVKREEV